ncbi:hypothetical protein HYPSUDRAFT_1022496 [Hypholoma sublateritium FD-334 SS-4]|uniref:HAT C-terminal dimerisation domain-containing protein n=1 Tax=Hypholoma sublateritium (strain FD-334 SS-4) TaxID=945553 RepID=A0A0D2KRY2_HYPSF|nr:hypothetical protein HYPSUDRAFT_1022496 [Hypholoma sublateritium FD-334 SS-4]
MTTIQWWGVNSSRFPVWSALARDYLAIMASSVSSERAFSSAGITISKRRNRLKGDIVEALQFLKCLVRKDLVFRERAPCSVLEADLEVFDDDGDDAWEDVADPKGWDGLVIDVDAPEDTEYNDDDIYM